MKLRKYIIGAVSTSLLALSGTAAQATSLEASQFGSVVHDADACVVGYVTNVSYETIDGQAFTMAKVRVQKVGFGDVSSRNVTIKMPGGRLTSAPIPVSETIAGMPRLFTYSQYFLLLDDVAGEDEMTVAGTFQGAISIVDGKLRLPETSTVLDLSLIHI